MTDIGRINREIALKFRQIEDECALCRSIAELFERLLSSLERRFALPYVWLSLLSLPRTDRLIREVQKSPLLSERLNVITEEAFREIVPDITLPILASGDMRPFFRLLPPTRKYFLRSIAVAPLTLDGLQIGSLNHGDHSPDRYRPGLDTSLLHHLATAVSGKLAGLLLREDP